MMRLQSLFLSVLNMGITAGWLTLTLLLLRPLLRGFPRVFSYLLWLVVYIRLLCPVSFTWAASLLGLLDRGKNASIPLAAMGTPRGAMPASFIDWAMTARGETPLPLPALSLLWFAGTVVMLLYGLFSYYKLRKAVHGAQPAGDGIYRCHTGADFAAPANTPIYAAQSGTVAYVSHEIIWPMGRSLIIDHGEGWQTLYAHCSQVLLEEGDTVAQGDLIAKVGCTGNATGNHCHFELRYRGEVVDPLDYLVGWDKKANRMTLA